MKLGLAVAVIALGMAFALRIAIRSYLDEVSDFERAPAPEISRRPESAGIPGLAEVRFGRPDAPLAGWYAPSRNRAAIILAHGTGADRSSLLPETQMLARAGFGVLALDFPGQGASAGRTLWGKGEREAISSAVDWLATRADVDASRIGAFGLSFGGYIVLQAASIDRRLRAIVLASTPSDIVEETRLASSRWGALSEWPALWALKRSGMPYDELKPLDVIGSVSPRAVFLIGGAQDGWVPESAVRALFGAAREPKRLWILQNAGHGGFAVAAPAEYENALGGFFSESLLR
jgi:dipeptidyl aminopeptidase/acylaminoacyl peptidase